MTAQINQGRPFVNSDGSLTQYGRSVMQSIWVAIGGATSGVLDTDTVEFTIVPTPPLQARTEEDPSVAPAFISAPTPGDISPVGAPIAAIGDVGPLAIPAAMAIDRATAYSVISVDGGTTGESTVDATPRKVAAFDTNGLARNMIVNGDDLIVVTGGTYLVALTASFSGTASKHHHMEIYVDSTGSGFATDRTLDDAGVAEAVSINAIIALKPAEVVSAYQWSVDGGTAMTITQASLLAVRLSD